MIKSRRNICVVTGTRAEYGLLRWVIQGINASDLIDLQLIVTGMHLSPESQALRSYRTPATTHHILTKTKTKLN